MKIKFICPLLYVNDIKKSRNFYETILQQKVKFDLGENITFVSGFAIQDYKHITNIIFEKNIAKNVNPSNNFELYFETKDIVDLFNVIKKENLKIIHNIKEQPWKQRVFRFYDYDNNIIEIGEPMKCVVKRLLNDNFSPKEVYEQTSIPIEICEQIAQGLEIDI